MSMARQKFCIDTGKVHANGEEIERRPDVVKQQTFDTHEIKLRVWFASAVGAIESPCVNVQPKAVIKTKRRVSSLLLTLFMAGVDPLKPGH